MFGGNNNTNTYKCPYCGAIMEPMVDFSFDVSTVVDYECPMCEYVIPAKWMVEAGGLDKVIRAFHILGIQPTSDMNTISSARKALAKKFHPDLFTDPKEKEDAERRMKKINEAYEIAERVITEGGAGAIRKKVPKDSLLLRHCISLGIKPTYYASDLNIDQIKSAYRERSKEVHPDTSGLHGAFFIAVRDAYEYLEKAYKRANE